MSLDSEAKPLDDNHIKDLSPGKLLSRARERAGLNQEQVAKELYMTLSKVRALENDDYGRLHSATFTRGYLRAYANFVKVDVNMVLAAYDAQAQKLGLITEYVPRQPEPSNKIWWRFIGSILGTLIVLWLISIWFFNNRQKPEYALPASMTPRITIPPVNKENLQVIKSAFNMESSSATQPIANAENASSSTASDVFATTANALSSHAASSSEASISNNTSTLAASLDEIHFSFNEECWLEVSDSRGDVLATELQRAGTQLDIKGKAPFDVKLGNAPAVEMSLNGRKIAIVPALGTDVLTLKVAE